MNKDFNISIEDLRHRLDMEHGFHIRVGEINIDERNGIVAKSKNVAPCCLIGGYGKLDLGFFREAQNLKTGIVPVDEMRLAAFGLTKEEFTRGLKELSKALGVGLLLSSPIVFMNLEKLVDARPQLGYELRMEEENSRESYYDYRNRKRIELRDDQRYIEYSDDELDDIIFESFKMKYPDLSETARKTEEYLSQDLDLEFNSPVPEEKNEASSRKNKDTLKIEGQNVSGYYLDSDSINQIDVEIDDVLSNIAPWFNEDQKEFFKTFFKEVGFTESCYDLDKGLFSIEKQVGGPALGFVQIEPETALGVLDEVLNGSPDYAETMKFRVQDSLGMDIQTLKEKLKEDMVGMLNDNRVAMVIMYLKFANRSFKGIPDFKGPTLSQHDKLDRAKIWKTVWNTSEGSGRVKDYIKRNETIQRYM